MAELIARHVGFDISTLIPASSRDPRWWRTLGAALGKRARRERRTLLSDVSFQLGDGDRLALFGLNGAGKTTLLRVLNGVYQPSRGQVVRRGTCSAMLNPTLGFNEGASLRENIVLRGTAMGLSLKELRREESSILDFAELEHRADDPLATLSAGQRTRLGFAITTVRSHDVLLLDEWVGAGDSAFVEKAQARMKDRFHGSAIVVLASHNLAMLRELCNVGLVLDGGETVFQGGMNDCMKAYHHVVVEQRAHLRERLSEGGLGGTMIGCVETVFVHGRVVKVSGWAVDGDIAAPTFIAIEHSGRTDHSIRVHYSPRLDVATHLGVPEVQGFDAEFVLPEPTDRKSLLLSLVVRAGTSPDLLGQPLHMGLVTGHMLDQKTFGESR